MNQSCLKILLLACLSLISPTTFSQTSLILHNGKIFTSDKKHLWAEAIAIRGARISAVGKNDAILKLKKNSTKVINLEGRVVVPGFNDAHDHWGAMLEGRWLTLGNDNPMEDTPWEMVRDSLVKKLESTPPGMLIHTAMLGPNVLTDKRIRREALDSIAPNNPILLASGGHITICNSQGLKMLGIIEDDAFLGGIIERDEKGKLTGLLTDYAQFRKGSILSDKINTQAVAKSFSDHYQLPVQWGVTTVQLMCSEISPQTVERVFKKNDFGCRIHLIAWPHTDAKHLRVEDWKNYFGNLSSKNYVSGVKAVMDGGPGTICVRQPYDSRPGYYGYINLTPKALKDYMEVCLATKQQIIIHAIGDSAAMTIIRVMKSMHPDDFWKDKRVRIEHTSLAINEEQDINAFRDLGLIAVQNPALFGIAKDLKKDFGSRVSLPYFQTFRSFLKQGVPIAIGADNIMNPFLNLMMASTHPDNPKEAISLEDAVIAYTHGSAYAEFKEKEKGTLTKGKLADLAVLSQDIFKINRDQLPSTESLLTIVDGKIVYDKKVLR